MTEQSRIEKELWVMEDHKKQRELKKQAESSFHEYIRQAWHLVEPKNEFTSGWHIEAICEHLEAVTRGEIRNLLINIPPRHMKSLAVSVFWPTWVWINDPSLRWLFASYAQSLSTRDSVKCRRIILSKWYQDRWGDRYHLTGDQNEKLKYENNKTGHRIATSVDGTGTGEGGDIIVVDDPHNLKEIHSDLKREGVLTWWSEVMSTRLNDPKTGRQVIVMQRGHEKDLSGKVLEEGGWEHLCLPAQFDPERKCFTSIGWEDPRAEEKELLWPERFDEESIETLIRKLGSHSAAGQLNQRPAPAEGLKFKKSWFRYFREEEKHYTLITPDGEKRYDKGNCWIFQTCDPAATEKQKSDYTVIGTWAVTKDNNLLLIDLYREQVETVEHEFIMLTQREKHKPRYQAVEDKTFGLAIFQKLSRLGIAIKKLKADTDKISRSIPMQVKYENGQVYHPLGVSWVNVYEEELLKFPNGAHDDCVDVASYAGIEIDTGMVQTPRCRQV